MSGLGDHYCSCFGRLMVGLPSVGIAQSGPGPLQVDLLPQQSTSGVRHAPRSWRCLAATKQQQRRIGMDPSVFQGDLVVALGRSDASLLSRTALVQPSPLDLTSMPALDSTRRLYQWARSPANAVVSQTRKYVEKALQVQGEKQFKPSKSVS